MLFLGISLHFWIFPERSGVKSSRYSRYSTGAQVISGNFPRKMIRVENGGLVRQSGYIIAPDLFPKKSELQRRTGGGGEEGEGGTVGMGEEITTETEGRNPSGRSLK